MAVRSGRHRLPESLQSPLPALIRAIARMRRSVRRELFRGAKHDCCRRSHRRPEDDAPVYCVLNVPPGTLRGVHVENVSLTATEMLEAAGSVAIRLTAS